MDEDTATATTDSQDAPERDGEFHRRVTKQIIRRFDMSLKAQGPRRRQWRRNEEMINGDHFAIFTPEELEGKSKVVLALCFEVVETIMPILTDILPKPDVIPDPASIDNIDLKAMMDTAQKVEDGIYHQWRGAEMAEEWPMMAKSALIYGNGPVRMLPGDGKFMDIEPVDVFGWFLDPSAKSVKKASWIMTATPVYLSELCRIYGEDARGIKAQGRLDAYRSFHLFPEKNRDGGSETMSGTAAESATMTDLVGTDEEAGQHDLDQVLLVDAWLDHDVNYDEEVISDEGGEAPKALEKYLHVTIAGDRVLVYEESDYEIGSPPFTQIINYPQPNSPWGKGESEQIETMNLAADVILSEAVDATILAGNPPLKITQDVKKLNPNGVKMGPREEIVLPNRLSLVEWMEHKNIPSEMSRLPTMFLELINTVSGVTDVTQGNKPGQVTAGYAIKALQSAAQGRIRFKEKLSLRGPLVDIYKHIMRHIKDDLNKPIAFIKRDRMGGDFRPASYGPDDFKDQDFIVRAGIPITENATEFMDLIVQIAPLAGLTPEQFIELLPSEIRDVIQSVCNRSQGAGPLAGIDPSLLTEDERKILQSSDEDAINNLLYSLQQRGIYSPPAQDFQSGMAQAGQPGMVKQQST